MKVKCISRNPEEYVRQSKKDINKVPRSYNPLLHQHVAGREYVAALNSAKINRIHAKPFLGDLSGHKDSVTSLLKNPNSLTLFYSGCCGGQIKIWDLSLRTCLKTINAHQGLVNGLCASQTDPFFYSVGNDKVIKKWSLNPEQSSQIALNTIINKTLLTGIDHHYGRSLLATCGETVDLWDEERTEPVQSYSWGVDTVNCVQFNPIEHHLLGSTVSDRTIQFYDIRQNQVVRKIKMEMRSNKICWNPMEAYHFTVANEDYQLYTFDMRKPSVALQVHEGHISAVMDVDYSPTGTEFVSASYDKTIRIFPHNKGVCRDIYHTKRMQRVECVTWSQDNSYILSASGESDIRLWKARASEKLGHKGARMTIAMQHNEKLIEKYAHLPKINQIVRHRNIPKHIFNGATQNRESLQKQKRKEAQRRAHSKPGTVPYKSVRTKAILEEK